MRTLEKKYRRARALYRIFLVLSATSCILPVLLFAALSLSRSAPARSLCTAAMLIGIIILFAVLRGLSRKLSHSLPYTLTVLLLSLSLLLFLICVERIIDDALAALTLALIGSAFGFVLELLSSFFKSRADELREFYLKERYDV